MIKSKVLWLAPVLVLLAGFVMEGCGSGGNGSAGTGGTVGSGGSVGTGGSSVGGHGGTGAPSPKVTIVGSGS
jgi:hypothetical protein